MMVAMVMITMATDVVTIVTTIGGEVVSATMTVGVTTIVLETVVVTTTLMAMGVTGVKIEGLLCSLRTGTDDNFPFITVPF